MPLPCAAASADASWRSIVERSASIDGRSRLMTRREVLALDVLHDEKRPALVLDDVVDDGDVGMRDAGGGARFVQNAATGARRPTPTRSDT